MPKRMGFLINISPLADNFFLTLIKEGEASPGLGFCNLRESTIAEASVGAVERRWARALKTVKN
jgi:hypothetical protein